MATKRDQELFGLKLKAEGISFDSINEVNIEARQAYSSALAGGWLYKLPPNFDSDGGIRSLDPESLDPDILILENKDSTYQLHFPAYYIAEGHLKVRELRCKAAKELRVDDLQCVHLRYKGKFLNDDNHTCKEEGLKHYSELLCVVSSDPPQHGGSPNLVAVARNAQEFAEILDELRHHVRDHEARIDITTLITEVNSTDAALRKLDNLIGRIPYDRYYTQISRDVHILTESMNYTFMDVRRLSVNLGRDAMMSPSLAQHGWETMINFFHEESSGSLRVRFGDFRLFVESINTLIEE